jgi:hypothetical protein
LEFGCYNRFEPFQTANSRKENSDFHWQPSSAILPHKM